MLGILDHRMSGALSLFCSHYLHLTVKHHGGRYISGGWLQFLLFLIVLKRHMLYDTQINLKVQYISSTTSFRQVLWNSSLEIQLSHKFSDIVISLSINAGIHAGHLCARFFAYNSCRRITSLKGSAIKCKTVGWEWVHTFTSGWTTALALFQSGRFSIQIEQFLYAWCFMRMSNLHWWWGQPYLRCCMQRQNGHLLCNKDSFIPI